MPEVKPITIEVDLKKKNYLSNYQVRHGDNTPLTLVVLDDGEAFDLTDIQTASLAITRRDKQVVVLNGVMTGNEAKFELGGSELSVPGRIEATAQFYDADGRISTVNFQLTAVKDPTGEGYLPSEDEATLIQVVLGDGPLVIEQAQEAADYANTQGDYALQVAVDNETHYLNAVETIALRDSTYPNPAHGDTVRITELGRTDRYVVGTGWVTTDVYNPVVIDEITTQLAEKATKTDLTNALNPKADKSFVDTELGKKLDKTGSISVNQIDKNQGKFDQTYMTDAFLQQIAGTTPVNATPSREGITRPKIADKAIDFANLGFIKLSNNLADVNSLTLGKSISGTTGLPVDNSTHDLTDYFYIKPNQSYIMQYVGRWGLYDESKTFISSNTTQSITTPSNAFYVRLAIPKTRTLEAQLNLGTTLLPFDGFSAELIEGLNGLVVKPSFKTITRESLTKDSVDPFALVQFKKSNNIFNKKDIIAGKTFDSNGNVTDSSTRVIPNNFIPVKPNTDYTRTFSSATINFYDKNKILRYTAVRATDSLTFTTFPWCHFIKIAVSTTVLETFMLNEGAVELPYEEYVFELQSTNEFPLKIGSTVTINGGGSGVNEDQVISIMNERLVPFRSYSYQRLSYADLVNSLSNTGCTIEQLGLSSDGVNHLYGLSYGDISTKPVIFVIGNQHGMEWVSAHYPVDFMTRIANSNYFDADLITKLSGTFAFYTIVSANPWGYINATYTNANNVNLNRNWDKNWSTYSTGEGTIQYKGTAPFSEPETQIVRDKILAIKPYMVIDCHASDGNGGLYTGTVEYKDLLVNTHRDLIRIFDDAMLPVQEWKVGDSPTATGWSLEQTSKEGTKVIPGLVEQPMLYSGNYGLTALFALSLAAYNRFTT